MAIDYCSTMATFAPSQTAKDFLLKQQVEEDTHLEMLTTYVGMHPRPEVLISPALKKLHMIMANAIECRDYVACVFVQNFIVEGLNVSLLKELEHHTDGELSELCSKILKDEIGHMEFGVTEISKILSENKDKHLLRKLVWLQRKTLFYSTLLALTLARESKDLGIPMQEFAREAVRNHFKVISRTNFPLPLFDKICFNSVILFLGLF